MEHEMIDELAKAIALEIGVDSWDYLSESERANHRNAATVAICTIIPAGGMALTAERVEDVRTVVNNSPMEIYDAKERGLYYAAAARLRALFPATEPAEEFSCTWGTVGCTCDGPLGDVAQKAANAAPAEPAEEETKAEARITGGTCEPGELHSYVRVQVPRDFVVGVSLNDLCSPEKAHELATLLSPPVVPAPTETGPWKTWQEVPDDTPFWSRDRRETNSWWWIKRTTGHRKELRQGDSCGETVHLGALSFMDEFAPFVAAEEG